MNGIGTCHFVRFVRWTQWKSKDAFVLSAPHELEKRLEEMQSANLYWMRTAHFWRLVASRLPASQFMKAVGATAANYDEWTNRPKLGEILSFAPKGVTKDGIRRAMRDARRADERHMDRACKAKVVRKGKGVR